MGCIWSGEDRDRCLNCNRRPVNNLTFIDNVCQICIYQSSRPPVISVQNRPRFGDYRCSCGRFWTSRLSWARTYQVCKKCRKRVYPQNQRDLRPSDLLQSKSQEHQRDFCQMCQQLGYHCSNFGKDTKRSRNRGKRY